MPILGTDAYRFALASLLADARTRLYLISAYITAGGMKWVLEQLNPSVSTCHVLARWNCGDLVSGASDLEAYELLHKRGGRFFVLPDLHAKVILVDNRELFVSSANITGHGLKLVPGGNREIGVKMIASLEDVTLIDTMFDESTEITPELYDDFRRHVELLKKHAAPRVREHWPTELLQKLQKGPKRLWVAEMFWCENPNVHYDASTISTDKDLNVRHDLTLLGFETGTLGEIDNMTLRARFMESRAWRWLIARLEESDGRELYFGRLSDALHDALLDDPKPYRQDVKRLVANLIGWVEELGKSSVAVDRPNYSQRLRLNR